MSKVITTTEELAAFCATFGDERFITVDTEFIRERTYYPQLCLLQVATSKQAVAIDPLAESINLDALYAAFADTRLIKVFHAASQDLEIFVHDCGAVPTPMYDTQIAAMVCGFGESASYETLVRELVGAKLDKASRFTDWAQRPLSDRQLSYALDDVIHLRRIFEILEQKIAEAGRGEWIAEEMAAMARAEKYQVDTSRCWTRLKVKSRAPEYLQLLRAAAAWREEKAMRRNIPRQRVMKDEWVVQVAAMAPESPEDLFQIRGIQGQLSAESAEALWEQLNAARLAPKEEFPKAEERYKPMPAAQEACYDQLRLLLRQCCEEAHVVPRLVADKDELEALVRGKVAFADASIAHGWRYEVFGCRAQGVLNGKLSASVSPYKGGFGLVWKDAS